MSLYGRIISAPDLTARPADYGSQVVERLAAKLSRDYGRGCSAPNLWDMKRFHAAFQILQPLARESAILSPLARESALTATGRTLPMASDERLLLDFSKHFHLGWSHYRILLSIADPRQRKFYFEQACMQRWSKRELHRQIAGALFERVPVSLATGRPWLVMTTSSPCCTTPSNLTRSACICSNVAAMQSSVSAITVICRSLPCISGWSPGRANRVRAVSRPFSESAEPGRRTTDPTLT
jgi:hypothetical protein